MGAPAKMCENPRGRSCEPSMSFYMREGHPLGIIDDNLGEGGGASGDWVLCCFLAGDVAGDGSYLREDKPSKFICFEARLRGVL